MILALRLVWIIGFFCCFGVAGLDLERLDDSRCEGAAMSSIDYLWYVSTIDYMRSLVRVRSPAELGALIRARRRELGLDQSALADKVGVSRQWIIEIEKGKPRAALGLVLRTLSALEVLLDARNEPPQRAKPSGTQVDLDALISAARKPRS
jgi:HTH-type transcriptional regulator / antitoxin HipB